MAGNRCRNPGTGKFIRIYNRFREKEIVLLDKRRTRYRRIIKFVDGKPWIVNGKW